MATPITDKEWAQILVHAWTDEAFRKKLEKSPTAALKEAKKKFGFKYDVFVHIPDPPADLTEEQLHAFAHGLSLSSPKSCSYS